MEGKDRALAIIEKMIEERNRARVERDYAKADKIRDDLDSMGIQLMDSVDPETGNLCTKWELKR